MNVVSLSKYLEFFIQCFQTAVDCWYLKQQKVKLQISKDYPTCKDGPWLVLDLDLGRLPTILTDKNGSLCLRCLHKQCSVCWTPAFLLGVRRCLHDQPPVQTLGTESNELPCQTVFNNIATTHSWGEFSMSCVPPLGEDSWKLALVSSGLHSMCLFFLADFALYQNAVMTWLSSVRPL